MTEAGARWFASFRQMHAIPAEVMPHTEWLGNVMQQAYDAGRATVPESIETVTNTKDGILPSGAELYSGRPEPAAEDERRWLIWFLDVDRPIELFSGYGATEAAHKRFEQVSVSWN